MPWISWLIMESTGWSLFSKKMDIRSQLVFCRPRIWHMLQR